MYLPLPVHSAQPKTKKMQTNKIMKTYNYLQSVKAYLSLCVCEWEYI